MADGAWHFYACHLCGELDKTARDADGVDGVNSIGFLWFSRSRFLGGASAVRRVSLSRSCLLASSAMSFRHPYSGSPLPCPLVMLPRHLSIMWPRFSLLTALSFAPSLVSYRLASPLALFLVSAGGAMSYLRALAACFSCPCDVVLGWRRERAACFVSSVM